MTTRTYIVALWVTAALGAVVAIAFAFAGRGTFEHRMLATAVAMAGALLLLVASALHWIARRAGRRWLRSIACGTALLGVVSLSQIESRLVGAIVHNRDVRAARAFAERVVARLEELQQRRAAVIRQRSRMPCANCRSHPTCSNAAACSHHRGMTSCSASARLGGRAAAKGSDRGGDTYRV